MYTSGLWNDLHCESTTTAYICERPIAEGIRLCVDMYICIFVYKFFKMYLHMFTSTVIRDGPYVTPPSSGGVQLLSQPEVNYTYFTYTVSIV